MQRTIIHIHVYNIYFGVKNERCVKIMLRISLFTLFSVVFSTTYSFRLQAVTSSRLSLPLAATPSTVSSPPCVIKVVGVGGAGGNAVQRMHKGGLQGPELWVLNTDLQALNSFKNSKIKSLQIGRDVTKGLGAGSIPSNGKKSAESSRQEIQNVVENTDLLFVTAGMGGGTGSGAAPIVAELARKSGALTIGVVTKPFSFEGRPRKKQAIEAIEALKSEVDTLITVSNDRLLRAIPSGTPVESAFAVADEVLRQAVAGVSDIIMKPGLVNVDFADVKSIMHQAGDFDMHILYSFCFICVNEGTALMGVGRASGKHRARDAAIGAISSPLLDFPILKAKGVIFNIVGGRDLKLREVSMCLLNEISIILIIYYLLK